MLGPNPDQTVPSVVDVDELPVVDQVAGVVIGDGDVRRAEGLVDDKIVPGVVDVLDDRESPTVATWLARHPEIEVITRDRAGFYIEGASTRDRWEPTSPKACSGPGLNFYSRQIQAHHTLDDLPHGPIYLDDDQATYEKLLAESRFDKFDVYLNLLFCASGIVVLQSSLLALPLGTHTRVL